MTRSVLSTRVWCSASGTCQSFSLIPLVSIGFLWLRRLPGSGTRTCRQERRLVLYHVGRPSVNRELPPADELGRLVAEEPRRVVAFEHPADQDRTPRLVRERLDDAVHSVVVDVHHDVRVVAMELHLWAYHLLFLLSFTFL